MKNIIIRRSNERGYFNYGWLETYHTFSFSNYYDPKFIGFESLIVINDDVIAPKKGFGLHPHKNMEIITYIIDGALTHSDNLGNKEEIKTGEVQIMSAGSGIIHSEWNYEDKPCHLLQIWIEPNQINTEPSYKIQNINHFERWGLIASYKSENPLKQNAEVYVINSESIKQIDLPISKLNKVWLHVANGEIEIEGEVLNSGDAVSFELNEKSNNKDIKFNLKSKVLLFYL